MNANVHSIESFSTLDGPGIRFVLFLKGCPLRCKYCHNVDAQCKDGGKIMSTDDVLKEVIKYRTYYGSNGGLTVSGGEPLVHTDFLIELFQKCKALGINTAIETSGCIYNEEKLEILSKVTDLFIVDLKHIDEEYAIKLTGLSNKNSIKFIKYLSNHNRPMWIRMVLLDGYTNIPKYLHQTVEFINTLNSVKRVEVLPYHTLGVHKYKNLGINYDLEGVEPPSKEDIISAKKILNAK